MLSRQRRICSDEYDADYFPDASFVPLCGDETYRLEALHCFSQEYASVSSKIDPDVLQIIRIDRVKNKFLKKCYELKKMQNPELKEKQLFHLTTKKSANKICKHNFNWRKCGTRNEKHYYGFGVYFSDSAEYASKFRQNMKGENVIFLVDVLVGDICKGERYMRIPSKGRNASARYLHNNRTLVKYDDNEFYPSYKITIRFKDHVDYPVGEEVDDEVEDNSDSKHDGGLEIEERSNSSNTGIALGVTAAVVGAGLLGLFLYNRNRRNE